FFDMNYGLKKPMIDDLLAHFNLTQLENQFCGLLSAGQKRQVGLLRLWMSNARLWLLDEPLVALDDIALAVIMDKIAIHRQQGGSVLLTSHQELPLNKSLYQEYHL
ncbi:MAG: ATP-binding cassette domain-containing protein, partial [bacterium]|nr:ATP-binding cassette domain-containing protein [bacterium]